MAKGIITTESGKGAPMRVAPDASAEMIGALAPNTAIELLHYGDGWYFVDVDGVQGYIAGSMVQALDGIEGLGTIKIKMRKNKNGKTDVAVQEVKPITKTVVKDINGQKKVVTATANSGILNKAKSAVKNAKNKNGKFVMTKEDAKKHLESLIKRAKAAGMTEDEIKQMASLNGLGRLTDLNGLNGKLLDAIKNVGTKIVDTGKKIVGAGQKAEEVKQVLTTPATATANTAPAAAVQPTPATVQADTTNLNTNIQNQSTMTDETKSKIKKIAIASAAVIGATTIGVIIYKNKKKKDAAANNDKGALNGVKKRRKKSKKSKKNTGNKLLKLK